MTEHSFGLNDAQYGLIWALYRQVLRNTRHIVRQYPVQVFPYRSQAFQALHGICLDLLHKYLVQQGAPGTAMTL